MSANLYKRGETWWCWYNAWDPQAQRKVRIRESTGSKDRQAATAFALRREREAADPTRYPAEDPTTLRDAAANLISDRRDRGRSPATLRYYGPKLSHWERILGSSRPLSTIDAKSVDAFISQRLNEGATRHTVAKELGALRSLLRVARRRGEYHRDPAEVLPLGWAPKYKPRKRWLPPKELDALLAVLAPERAAQVAFIVASGARLAGAERARRKDIDLKGGLIRVRDTKTDLGDRTVPILPYAEKYAGMAFDGASVTGLAYPKWSNIRRDLALACEKAGIAKCTPNDLRRTAGQWLRERVGDADLVGDFLGHVDGRMARLVYGRLEGERLASVLKKRVGKGRKRNAKRKS